MSNTTTIYDWDAEMAARRQAAAAKQAATAAAAAEQRAKYLTNQAEAEAKLRIRQREQAIVDARSQVAALRKELDAALAIKAGKPDSSTRGLARQFRSNPGRELNDPRFTGAQSIYFRARGLLDFANWREATEAFRDPTAEAERDAVECAAWRAMVQITKELGGEI